MRRLALPLLAIMLLTWPAYADDPPGDDSPGIYFYYSLHSQRPGKNYWYGEENGGFESFTGVPIEQLGCTECHGPANANGIPYPADYHPGCYDCHPADANFFNFTENQCYGCHGRQKTEAVQLALPDVHRAAGMKCWDCHNTWDMHGDGTPYATMFDPDAVTTDCANCHIPEQMSASHDAYDPHGGALHCSACHTRSVISCYNCHFESQVESHVKRAKQPIFDFVLLGNRHEDGKVYPMSFQSLTYRGDSFVAFAPYSAHTIVREGRVCTECHVNQPIGGSNAAIEEYNATGQIQFATLQPDGSLRWVHGVVPMPADYETTFKMDFITYDGATSDPPAPSNNWSPIGENLPDGHQMFFISPLTYEQMDKLGFDAFAPILGVGDRTGFAIAMAPAVPNPVRSSTTLGYALAADGDVSLAVYDIRGARVATLVEGRQPAGRHDVMWDGSDAMGVRVPAGVYFARLRAGAESRVTKVLVAR